MNDTPDLSRRYCPGCDLDADPTREILSVQFCPEHYPSTGGADDGQVRAAEGFGLSPGEFDAETNRRVNDWLSGRVP